MYVTIVVIYTHCGYDILLSTTTKGIRYCGLCVKTRSARRSKQWWRGVRRGKKRILRTISSKLVSGFSTVTGGAMTSTATRTRKTPDIASLGLSVNVRVRTKFFVVWYSYGRPSRALWWIHDVFAECTHRLPRLDPRCTDNV